ncbi:hypothetical protein LIER_14604 [Lithospermum erythrorhizon]|uniref:Reverse transcriptase n=1 Tax=Lithospermum erythrorhizon TaxID=34254 RepID=A0AAV3Q237_LITER
MFEGEFLRDPVGSRGGPVSHLLFADDTVLFGDATKGEARSIMSILNQYECLSGQLVAYDKLCREKSNGGLGFRDNHAFNIALLSKQAWRIASDPSSQIAQVYKAKYFPHGTFWNAKIGNKSSLTCRNLLYARDLLIKGVKWSVGNEKTIEIWNHRWLPHTHSNRLITPINPDYANLRLYDIIDNEIGIWNITLIIHLFFSVDADFIMSMPLHQIHRDDSFVWDMGNSKQFTVKSVYQLYRENGRTTHTQPSTSSSQTQRGYF